MKERTTSSIVIIAVSLSLVILSNYIVYPLGLSVLAVIAVFEVIRVIGAHRKLALSIPAYLFAAAFPIGAYFVNEEMIPYFLLALSGGMFLYLIWLMGVSVFSKGQLPLSRASEVFAAVIYVTVSVTSLSLIRYLDRGWGVFAVVLVFVISWVCDTAAFAVGSLMGKHKLIPEVSPKKTIEGSIGGIIFTVIFCLIYGLGVDLIVEGISVNYLVIGLCGLLLSVVSQIGDLIASLIKREHGVKDYGSILPGHGGFMDRFDSVLAVSIVLLIICMVFPPFTI